MKDKTNVSKKRYWGRGEHWDFSGGKKATLVCFIRELYLPGAKCAAIGAYVVERGLSGVGLLFPLPFVDDELPLEMGQELEVLLLLGHTYHLRARKKCSGSYCDDSMYIEGQIMCADSPRTFSFPGNRLSNFFCREKVKVSQPMLEACLPCQKYTTHWKSSSGCLSSSSSAAPPPPPPPLPPPSFFSFSSSSYSTGTQYLWKQSEIRGRQWLSLTQRHQSNRAPSLL